MNRSLAALTLAAMALAAPAASAAPDGAPAPDCHGVSVNDKAGDNVNGVTQEQGSPSSDLTGGYITYDPASGKAKANIQVAELTAGEIDPPYLAISWEFMFTTSDGPRYLRAYQDLSGTVEYTWGEPRAITDDQTTPRAGGDTTGALFPGKDGVISIDIPMQDIGAPAGSSLKALALEVRQWLSLPAAVPSTGLPIYSVAPIYDEATGRGQVALADCAAAAPVPAPPTGGPVTPPSPPATSDEPLQVKATVGKLSARKLRKGRRVTVRLSGTASDIVARLRKGSKTVATGRLKSLDGRGKLKLKLRRKVKKGSYRLVLTGVNADGSKADRTFKVRVRR